MNWLFGPTILNFVATLLAALLVGSLAILVAILYRPVTKHKWRYSARLFFRTLPIIAALLALFLTYSTVRFQTKLAAETSYNQTGNSFVEWELNNENFRCLYGWHAYDNPAKCLDLIMKNEDSYSSVMLYIEEALYLLEQAKKGQAIWGADYAEDVKYWAKDVSADPTGMFSYQIVLENPGDFQGAQDRAGISISRARLCGNYRAVREHLVARGAKPAKEVACN
ncbi:hypothetical protein [Brevundimonas sp.]|uniref:hypothetical protein n=1 Tax=Brevundimonas sp. TaxID=1871086 RepID=UPI0027309E2C|nr:hypothetical protein [Brevundimonas sp.]MDP1913354.1 hypothetical protein [Brevundimonas sp.]